MKRKWAYLVTVILLALTVAVIYKSTLGDVSNERVPEGSLVSLTGAWGEPEAQSDGSLIVTYRYEVTPECTFDKALLLVQSYWTSFTVECKGEVLYTHAKNTIDGYVHLVSLDALQESDEVAVVFHVWDIDNLPQLYGSRFLIGDQSGIYSELLHENLYAFVFAMLALVMGAAVIGMSSVLRKTVAGRYRGIAALGLFILVAGIWVLTDSDLLLLVTARTRIVTTISFLAFYSMPIFLLRFTRQMMKMDERVYRVLSCCFAMFFALYAVNYLFPFCATNVLLYFEHALLIVTLALIMFYALREVRKSHSAKLKRVVIGYAFFCICSAAALVMFYVRPFGGYSQLYTLGTAGFIALLFDAACRETYEQLERSVNLEFRARLAYMDAMTNVGNRAAFHEKQVRDQNYDGPLAYLMVDINNLKVANDTLGHAAGDQLIIRAAQSLKKAVGGLGSCYRIGGDEFIACMRGVTEDQANECLMSFYALVAQGNETAELPLSAAAGCVWSDDRTRDLDLLFRQADAEMYKEKMRIKGMAAKPES